MQDFKSVPLKQMVQEIIQDGLDDLKGQNILVADLHLKLVGGDEQSSFYQDKSKAIWDLQNWLPKLINDASPLLRNNWGEIIPDLILDPEGFHMSILKTQVECELSQLHFIQHHANDTITITDDIIGAINEDLAGITKAQKEPELYEILIIWSTEDVLTIRPDLTHVEAFRVLRKVKAQHDANIGVTWKVLNFWADTLYPLNN